MKSPFPALSIALTVGLVSSALHAAAPASGENDADATVETALPEGGVQTAKPGPVLRPEKPKKGTPAAAPPTVDTTVPRPKEDAALRVQKDPASGRDVYVVNNADLERRYGPSTARAGSTSTAAQPPSAPAERNSNSTAGRAAADARRAEIEKELERLRRNQLKIANPLIGAPVQNEEEKGKMRGMDNAARLAQTKEQIAQLEAELATLQADGAGSAKSD
jgi:hypothetical protein